MSLTLSPLEQAILDDVHKLIQWISLVNSPKTLTMPKLYVVGGWVRDKVLILRP